MSFNRNIRIAILALVALGASVMIYFAYAKLSVKRCKGIEINIKDSHEQFLISKEDIENWVTLNKNEPFEGKIIDKIDLSLVENRVKSTGIVKNCQAFINLQGYLVIDAETYFPIARILGSDQNPSRLLDISGVIFPFSKHFSPTVLLISGDYFEKVKTLKDKKNEDLLLLIKTIVTDDFWNAQIAQIVVDPQMEVNLLPVMGKHNIEFGKPEKINSKLNKLITFYKQILPVDKWSDFSKISVKYDGQIVCN